MLRYFRFFEEGEKWTDDFVRVLSRKERSGRRILLGFCRTKAAIPRRGCQNATMRDLKGSCSFEICVRTGRTSINVFGLKTAQAASL